MSDTKSDYSEKVAVRKAVAAEEEWLAKQIQRGYERKQAYGEGWESVNINEVVDRIAPGATGVFENGKIIYYNQEKTRAVVTDISGYLRIKDLTWTGKTGRYLDAFGKEAYNYTDSLGKQHGRSRAEYNKATHFIVLKREEM